MSDLEWNGDAAIKYVKDLAIQGLTRAALVVCRRAKELLSIPGTAVSTGKGGPKAKKGRRVTGATRSAPGEPPRKQTGFLREHVTFEVDESSMEARVGTNLLYGKALELGTKRGLLPRPWLRRALAETQGEVNDLLTQSKDQV
jgi:hypothetical protein